MNFFHTTLAELRPTLRLAAPITAGQVGQMLMGVTDTIMVGQVSTLALAACALANNVLIVVAVTGYGVLTAVSIRVSHAHGAGGGHTMARALHAGIGLSLFGGIAAALLLHAAYPLLHHAGQTADVVAESRAYLLIVGWSLAPAWIMSSAKNYLDARSHPWPAFWITLGGVLLNIILNWVLIFGKLGAPALGLTGAGAATLLSRVAGALTLWAYIQRSRWRPDDPWRHFRTWWREQREILRLGVPTGLQLLGEVGAFAAMALLIGRLGAIPLAAHQIAMTCASTTFMFPLGLAMASTVRVAQAGGAGRSDLLRPIAAGAWAVGVVFMSVFALVFLMGNQSIARVFVRDPAVAALAASLLIIAGIFQLIDGVQVVASGLLRGLRDTRGPMMITVAAYWVVALPMGIWLTFYQNQGARGLWIGLATGLALAATLLVRRFWQRSAPEVL